MLCFSAASQTLAAVDNPNTGLIVCGNGTGANSEQTAIDNLISTNNTPPDAANPKYHPNGNFDNGAYNKDLQEYLANPVGDTAYNKEQQAQKDAQYKNNSCQFIDLFRQIVKVINYLMTVAGIFFVARIVYSGAMMVIMSSDVKEVTNSKKALGDAAVGFIIILCSFAAVNIIFQLLSIKLNASFPLNPFK